MKEKPLSSKECNEKHHDNSRLFHREDVASAVERLKKRLEGTFARDVLHEIIDEIFGSFEVEKIKGIAKPVKDNKKFIKLDGSFE